MYTFLYFKHAILNIKSLYTFPHLEYLRHAVFVIVLVRNKWKLKMITSNVLYNSYSAFNGVRPYENHN